MTPTEQVASVGDNLFCRRGRGEGMLIDFKRDCEEIAYLGLDRVVPWHTAHP